MHDRISALGVSVGDRPRSVMLKKAALLRWGLLGLFTAAMLVAAISMAREKLAEIPPLPIRNPRPAPEQPKTPEETAYFEKRAEYQRIRGAYEKEAEAYWNLITDKRKARRQKRAENQPVTLQDYVLDHPPTYQGPPEPAPPPSLVKPAIPSAQARAPIPVVADFLTQAKTHFGFEPERPATEAEFKRAYAEAALKLGITKDQAVRIYGFEATGNGRHDVQAGLESSGSKRRAISTALGYNQLLVTNSISLLAEHGGHFIAALNDKLPQLGPDRRARLEKKIAVLRKMMRFTHSVPRAWNAQDKLARSPRGIGVHALNLDIDIGPLLQAQKLADSIVFARRKGYQGRLTAAELEMMNLMGDGSGFDVVSMPDGLRPKVPTANMFQRGGYDRNPVVRRNNTVAALLSATDAKMDQQTELPGAKELAAAFDAAGLDAANASATLPAR
jgi:hypothetical protein